MFPSSTTAVTQLRQKCWVATSKGPVVKQRCVVSSGSDFPYCVNSYSISHLNFGCATGPQQITNTRFRCFSDTDSSDRGGLYTQNHTSKTEWESPYTVENRSLQNERTRPPSFAHCLKLKVDLGRN